MAVSSSNFQLYTREHYFIDVITVFDKYKITKVLADLNQLIEGFSYCLCQALNERAKGITGVHQWPYRAISRALEVIPRTLIQNCGASTIRVLTALRVSILVHLWQFSSCSDTTYTHLCVLFLYKLNLKAAVLYISVFAFVWSLLMWMWG